jgi:hypothetical protein
MRLKELFREAGFVNCHESVQKLPFGPWPADKKLKLIGRWYLSSMETAFEAYGLALFTRVLNMDPKEGKVLCAAAWRDVQGRKVHKLPSIPRQQGYCSFTVLTACRCFR